MGVEARYHAVPEDWYILTEVCKNARFADYLQFLNDYLNDSEYYLGGGLLGEDPEENAFKIAVKSLKAARPGIEQRYFYEGSRKWDVLSYLLSSEYRNKLTARQEFSIDTINDPLFWAAQGHRILHPDAYATQGYNYRFLGVADTQLAYDLLITVQPEALQPLCQPPIMHNLGVYRAKNADFEHVWGVIQQLRHFYAQTVSAGEATLVVID